MPQEHGWHGSLTGNVAEVDPGAVEKAVLEMGHTQPPNGVSTASAVGTGAEIGAAGAPGGLRAPYFMGVRARRKVKVVVSRAQGADALV